MAHETADEIVFTRFGKRDGILSGGVFLAAAHCAVRVLRLGDDLHVMRPWVESEGCDESIKTIGSLVTRLSHDCIRG